MRLSPIEEATHLAFSSAAAEHWGLPPEDVMATVCEDKSVGKITYNGDRYSFNEQTKFKCDSVKSNVDRCAVRRLILVLESPHKEEYQNNGAQVEPAKGRSGINIRAQLGELLCVNLPELRDPFEVLLVNAVRYQCSQGCSQTSRASRSNRDRVFRAAFSAEAQAPGKEFGARMSDYVRAGDIVINCCTAGVTKAPLRDLVRDSLSTLAGKKGFDFYCTTHPAARFNPWRKSFREHYPFNSTTDVTKI